ncbi:MAG: transcriptional regulator [Candidatus Schekmanbacteria bacterium GWA2_38_11]|uniref:Transcriptional regulator n=1 Tax=Candidatus Schekmanbacteria bacterium GWA2_38_11 TaxID=1817876 RepID=A0A1F7RCQ6_9BACT|nr:MAG: transcriptional regulator [Candidatus Schekmanbacteria bacterium GWA2_38_11]
MAEQKNPVADIFRKKFEMFAKLKAEIGEQKAWEKMFEGYPERQRKNMGALIDNATLAAGFSKGIPLYKQIGMDMEVIDISHEGMDAVLEIQRACPALSMCKEYGIESPCHVICEMDVEASKKAFPGMKGEILSRKAEGSCVCIFKYERKGK